MRSNPVTPFLAVVLDLYSHSEGHVFEGRIELSENMAPTHNAVEKLRQFRRDTLAVGVPGWIRLEEAERKELDDLLQAVEPNVEPTTGLPVGLWFDDQAVWAYHGTLPVVLDVENLLDPETPKVRTFRVSRCPPCERSIFANKRVVRWMILPP